MSEQTWDALVAMESGTILKDSFDEGVRTLIMRGRRALCAYVGIPLGHPLAGHNYDDIPIPCHGGLTYAGEGSEGYRPVGFYWYGWDYAHFGDRAFFDFDFSSSFPRQEWLVKDVESDMWEAVYDFKKLVKLAEVIQKRFLDNAKSVAA